MDYDFDVVAQGSACIPQETEIRDVKLAHGYVPWQKFCDTMSPMMGLMEGTVFPELSDSYHSRKMEGEMR